VDIGRVHPEFRIDRFTRHDGTVRFFNYVHAIIGRGDDSLEVLEFGAGRGSFFHDGRSEYRKRLQDLRSSGAVVTAADIDPVVETHPCSDHQVVIEAGKPLPFDDGSFDVIVSDFTFEHLPDPGQVAGELLRVLKPGGWLCARTVNKWGYVAMVSRLVPNALHARLLGRIQPQRSEADVFPTVYRLNTPGAARRHFSGHEVIWYHDNGDPAYHFGNGLLYRLLLLGHRLLPARLATSICIFVRKSSQP
jgi:SAM-dependent methyltransferase